MLVALVGAPADGHRQLPTWRRHLRPCAQGQEQFINALTIGGDLRPDRARLHDGLRHHRAHQLRPRRSLHVRLVRRRGALLTTLGFTGAITDPLAAGRRRSCSPSGLDAGHGRRRRRDRAPRLPAPAQRPAPGPADHRDRRVVHPPEHRLRGDQQLDRHMPQIIPNPRAHDRADRHPRRSTCS